VIQQVMRCAATGILMWLGVAKIVSSSEASQLLPGWAYYTIGASEVLAGILLWSNVEGMARAYMICVCILGVSAKLVWPDRSCGCFGSNVSLEGAAHFYVAIAIGTLLLLLRGREPGVRCGPSISA